jgi:uncharacterized protein
VSAPVSARRMCAALLCALALAAGTAVAQPFELERVSGLRSTEERLAEIGGDLRARFDAVMREYDEELAQRPYDVAARLGECDFIDTFASQYEYLDWIDEAFERRDACYGEIEAQFPEHPEIKLRAIERVYPDAERIAAGTALIRELDLGAWTPGQKARLFTRLAEAAERASDAQAMFYAREALRFDERADVRLLLARVLSMAGDKQGAVDVLASPFEAHGDDDTFYLSRKLAIQSSLGLREQATATHARLRAAGGYYSHVEVARAMRLVGDIDAARDELAAAADPGDYTTEDERQRFLLELEHGSGAQALAAYDAWRDAGWWEDPVGIIRWSLFVRHPDLAWQLRDLLGVLGFAAAIGGVGLLVLLPIAAVHYRGLARRARSGEPYPVEGWRLSDAWLALFALTAAGVLALYGVGPIDLFSEEAILGPADDSGNWSHLLLVQSLAAVVLLLPVAMRAGERQPKWWGPQWSLGKSVLVGAATALGFRIPLLLAVLAVPDVVTRLVFDDELWRLIGAASERYGSVSALWDIAVVTPLVEEFVYRGVLLGALSKHLKFGWANALQAALFSAAHVSLGAAPILFGVGAVAGLLARRSGGLLAPIVMHGAFNLLAGLVVLTR